MEQEMQLSCAPQSSASENGDFGYFHHQIQSPANSSANFFSDPFDIAEAFLPPLSPFQNCACNSLQPECNTETKNSEPSQASACPHEGTSYNEDCDCDSDESPENSVSDDREILGEIIEDIFEEIIVEHCFQIHHAKKLGAFIFEDANEESSEEQEDPPISSVTCPNCHSKHELKDYKTKLGECMHLTTRKSSRKTRTRSNFAETAIDSFPSNGQSKNKKRRPQSKKAASKKQDNSDVDSKELCGHVTKSGNKCTKRGICSAHKPQTKSTVPQTKSTAPETKSAVPQTKSAVPQTKSVVPQTKSAVPQTKSAVPQTKSAVPQTKSMVPQTKSIVPQTKIMVPQTKNMVPQTKSILPQTKSTEPVLGSSCRPSTSFIDGYETIDVDTVEEIGLFSTFSNCSNAEYSTTRREENGKIKMIIKSDTQKKKKKKKSKHDPPGSI